MSTASRRPSAPTRGADPVPGPRERARIGNRHEAEVPRGKPMAPEDRPGRSRAAEARRPRGRARRRGKHETRAPIRPSRQGSGRRSSYPLPSLERLRSQTDDDLHDTVPRLQGVVRRRAGDPRTAARRRAHRSTRRGRYRRHQHLLRDERSRCEIAAGCGAGCAGSRSRLRDRMCGEPLDQRVRRDAGEHQGRLAAQRGRRRSGCGRRRSDRVRSGRSSARAGSRVREDPGRLLVLVRVLRHPSRPRVRRAVARPRPFWPRFAAVSAQGHREVVLTGVNLGCFRDRAAGLTLAGLIREAGAIDGLARLRLSSIEINHVTPRPDRRDARDTDRRAPSARAAAVGRRRRPAGDGSPVLDRPVSRAPRRAARTSTSRPT